VRAIGKYSDYRYINCGGVIVLDLKSWRETNMEQRFIDYITQWNGNPPFVDQGTINKICRTGVLSPVYNVINPMFMYSVKEIKKLFKVNNYYTQAEIDNAKENPVVIHYTGEMYNRPWCYGCTHPLKQYYLEYLEKTPWAGLMEEKELSKNCKIQNWVYNYCPSFVYLIMIRFIEIRHILMKRSMKGDTKNNN
jgi:lipopolysaccharide biosynthesis glycosyltransferase